MARRRPGQPKGARSKARGVDSRESKIKRWNKPSDIPLDEEDQFHTSRDKILLQGDDYANDDDDDGDEDEVFALKGMPDGSEDGDEDADGGHDDGAEGSEDDNLDDLVAAKENAEKSKGKKGKAKAKGKGKAPSSSSEEDESEEEEEGWGNTKGAYYSSNAAQLESDDEEANELEEQEARRLQAKLRDAMGDDDFGLDDPVDVAAESEDVFMEGPPPATPPLPQDKHAILRHLEKTNPEALALAREWDDIAYQLVASQAKINALEAKDSDAVGLGMAHLHYQTLLTYVTTVAFYLHLRAQEKYAQRPELLRSHPVLSRLLSLKKSLATLEDLNFGLSDDEDEENLSDEDEELHDMEQLWSLDKKKGLGLGELEALLKDADLALPGYAEDPGDGKKRKSKRRPKAASEEPPKKKRKAGTTNGDAKPVFDLVEPDFSQLKASSSRSRLESASVTDVYGEATTLQAADAADKKARKKSLRFHTAKIESTSARRQNARASAVGGDDDIPYRERKKEKDERLAREAAKKRGQGGEDLDDAEPEARRPEKKGARESDHESGSDGEDGSGYYQLIQRQSKDKKERKKAEYEAVRAAERIDVDESTDGPRALTRAILKNKGLTPHRGKSVRNPRVKKRQRFEKAKKKVASQKAVYKGGVGDTGRYDGEKTGISRVVKSIRL